MQVIPSALDVIGALSIFLSAVAITFEKQIFTAVCGRCCIRRPTEENEEIAKLKETYESYKRGRNNDVKYPNELAGKSAMKVKLPI